MMMHIKDITSYCASLTLVCTDLVVFFLPEGHCLKIYKVGHNYRVKYCKF